MTRTLLTGIGELTTNVATPGDPCGTLRDAALLIEDGRIDAFVQERYASFEGELGRKIRKGETTLQELSERALSMKRPALPGSGRQEYLQSVLNDILFGG